MTRAVVLAVVLAGLAAGPASAAPGVLDPGWASGGVFTGSTFVEPYDDQQVIALDAQGRTLLAVTQDTGPNQQPGDDVVVVSRLLPTGALDPTFNPAGAEPGTETLDFNADAGSGHYAAARGIRPGLGGTIVVLAAVVETAGGDPQIGLARLTDDGSYDSGFDTNGRKVIDFSPSSGTPTEFNPYPETLLVDATGRMLVAGTEAAPSISKGFVGRFTAGGALDPTWDGDGVAHVGGSGSTPFVQLHALAPLPGGGVVAAGQYDVSALAVELDGNGAPVPGFGSGGTAISDFAKGPIPFSTGWAFAVATDSLGRVLIGGQMTPSSGSADPARAPIVRFTPTGLIDPTWGTGSPAPGVVWLPLPAYGRVTGLIAGADDRIVAGGLGGKDPDGPGGQLAQNAPAIGRLLASGGLDPAFGDGGFTSTIVGGYANGFGIVADAARSRLLQVGLRRLAAGFDVRAIVLGYTDDGATPAPPGPLPVPPPAPAPPAPPAAPGRKPAKLTLAAAVRFPSTKRCASRRNFAIRLRVPVGAAVTQAVVVVNGKRVAVRKGSRLRSTVNLKGLPKGRFTVTITLKLGDGRTLKGTRAYRTCAARPKAG